jgi:hypothetical protein
MLGKNNKKNRKEQLQDYLKKIFNDKKLNESAAPAPAPVKPATKPATPPKKQPIIPKKWPGPMPAPAPKANVDNAQPAPAEPTIKPTTKPAQPKKQPIIPKRWPGPMPAPAPKAQTPVKRLNEDSLKRFFKKIALFEEKTRMNNLLEVPMKFDNDNPERPNPHFKQGLEGGESPFKDIDLFKQRTGDQSTLEKVGSEEFGDVSKKVRDTGGKAQMGQIMQGMGQLMQIESAHIPALEQLALDIVKRKMGLSDEVMEQLEARLRPNEDIPESDFGSPEEEAEEAVEEEFTDEEMQLIKQHADKRIINNALMMGAGYRAHSSYAEVAEELNRIDRRIAPLYQKIWPSIEMYLWQMVFDAGGGRVNLGKSQIEVQRNDNEQEQGEEQGEEQGGEQGGEQQEEQTNVKGVATARLFVVLLHEVSKVAVELLMAQSLINVWEQHGDRIYRAVMEKSDSYAEEQWMKLIGPRLWKYLHDAIDYVVHSRGDDYSIVSYVLNRMSLMEPQEFMGFMKNVLHDGQTAISQIENMIDSIESDLENASAQSDHTPSPEELDHEEGNPSDMANDIGDEIQQLYRDAEAKSQQKSSNQPMNLETMSIEQLQQALHSALDDEDYAMAAKIRDEITKKK